MMNDMDEASRKNLNFKGKYGKIGQVKGGETTKEAASRHYEGIRSVLSSSISSIGPAFKEAKHKLSPRASAVNKILPTAE